LAAIGEGAIGAGAAEAGSVAIGAAGAAAPGVEAGCAAAVRGDDARTQSASEASVAARRAEIGWVFRM